MLVSNEDGVDVGWIFPNLGQARERFPAAQSGVQKYARSICSNESAVAGTG